MHDDGRLWIQRPVEALSLYEIDESVDKNEALKRVRKIGNYTLSLLYHNEIIKAAQRSPLNFMDVEQIARAILADWPESLNNDVVAKVDEIRQMGKWISLIVSYPEFEQERNTLTAMINDLLRNDEYQWRAGMPHVSIGIGDVSKVGNSDVIKAALPASLTLAPAQRGF